MRRRFYKKQVNGKKELKKLAILTGKTERRLLGRGLFPPTEEKNVPAILEKAMMGLDCCPFCGFAKCYPANSGLMKCADCGEEFSPKEFSRQREFEEAAGKVVEEGLNLIRRKLKMTDFGESRGSSGKTGRMKGDQGSFADFFKGSDLPAKGTVTAKITGWREESLEFSEYQLDFKIGNKDWTLGLRNEEDGRLRALIKVLGGKTSKWIGKSFKMARHSKLDRSGNPRIQILPN